MEKDIEKYLVSQVRISNGKAYKWTSPGNDGVPDRIVIWHDGRIVFVELKAPGRKPTPIQLSKHNELRRLKQTVVVLDSREAVDSFIRKMKEGDAK